MWEVTSKCKWESCRYCTGLAFCPYLVLRPFGLLFPNKDLLIIKNLHLFTDPGCGLQDPDFETKFPFANCGNPVMALVGGFSKTLVPFHMIL